jgi:uncharacterized OB-fold protein
MVKLPTVKCKRCGHEWIPRVENPKWCSRCNSPYWDKERVRQIMKEVEYNADTQIK